MSTNHVALYSAPHTTKAGVGHMAHMGEERKVYKVLVVKPKGKRPLRRPRYRWRWEDGIRMDLGEIGGRCGVN
jgi:hypothetical protein